MWKRDAPTAMVVIGSQLVRNACSHLSRKEYQIDYAIPSFGQLGKVVSVNDYEEESSYRELKQSICRKFTDYVSEWFIDPIHSTVPEMFSEAFDHDLNLYNAFVKAWSRYIDKKQPSVVFTRFPAAAELVALAEVCTRRGIPFVAGQHGVSREIEATYHRCRSVMYENSLTDLFLAYNQKSVDADKRSPFKHGESVAVGLSSNYFRVRKWAPKLRKYPIVYVSTGLLSGNVQMLKGGYTDIDRVDFEMQMVDNLFGRLSSGVMYKAYHSTIHLKMMLKNYWLNLCSFFHLMTPGSLKKYEKYV
jgi:hypothetical protein